MNLQDQGRGRGRGLTISEMDPMKRAKEIREQMSKHSILDTYLKVCEEKHKKEVGNKQDTEPYEEGRGPKQEDDGSGLEISMEDSSSDDERDMSVSSVEDDSTTITKDETQEVPDKEGTKTMGPSIETSKDETQMQIQKEQQVCKERNELTQDKWTKYSVCVNIRIKDTKESNINLDPIEKRIFLELIKQ